MLLLSLHEIDKKLVGSITEERVYISSMVVHLFIIMFGLNIQTIYKGIIKVRVIYFKSLELVILKIKSLMFLAS